MSPPLEDVIIVGMQLRRRQRHDRYANDREE
jgi:hypothetical protein